MKPLRQLIGLFVLVVTLGLPYSNAQSSILKDNQDIPIATYKPNLRSARCSITPGPLFAGHGAPLPTNTWWSDLGVLNQDTSSAGPYPYMTQALPNGLAFGVGTLRHFDGITLAVPYQTDLIVNAVEVPANINNHKVLRWDQLSAQISYFNGGSTMTAFLVQGSPYMTFQFSQSTPNVAVQGALLTFNDQPVSAAKTVSASGQRFTLTLNNGAKYVIYSLGTSVSVIASLTGVKFTSGKLNGVLRFARVNTTLPNCEAMLDKYSANYATGADISYTVQGDTALVNFKWNVVGDANNVLMCAWSHHRELLVNPSYVSDVEYLTAKGTQRGVLGSWTLKYQLTTIGFHAPRKPVPSCLPYVIKALRADVASLTTLFPGDFYGWGTMFGRVARLALIAEETGQTDLIPTILTVLKASFAPWINGKGTDPIAYETAWGGVCSGNGTTNVLMDFGNGYYNDHHFHYGYHLYGASVIARFDPSWLTSDIKAYLTNMARDIGNPSTQDPFFTITRTKDWFTGHSWASGIAKGEGDRDEESSTEAINGYYGLYLFSLVTNDTNLQDFSRLLLAMEIQSVRHYWHLYPNDNSEENPYPEAAFRALTTVGNVISTGAGAWLYWGTQKLEITSIQTLPVTPITEEVLDRSWVQSMYPYGSQEISDPKVDDAWKSFLYIAHAVLDPKAAYSQAVTLKAWGQGNSNANTLWWISTRQDSESTPTCTG